MKTSNYILIAFFTLLFGGVLGLFVAAKFQPKVNLIGHEKTLESFSVIIAEPGTKFNLQYGDPKIISFNSTNTPNLPRFANRNDTLIIYPYPDKDVTPVVLVYVNNITQIQGKENSDIVLQDAKYTHLFVTLDKANFKYFNNHNDIGSTVKLLAGDSHIELNTFNFENLEVQLNNTHLYLWNNSLKSLSGTLTNKSHIHGRISKNINIDADPTCNYNFNSWQ